MAKFAVFVGQIYLIYPGIFLDYPDKTVNWVYLQSQKKERRTLNSRELLKFNKGSSWEVGSSREFFSQFVLLGVVSSWERRAPGSWELRAPGSWKLLKVESSQELWAPESCELPRGMNFRVAKFFDKKKFSKKYFLFWKIGIFKIELLITMPNQWHRFLGIPNIVIVSKWSMFFATIIIPIVASIQ